MTPTRGAILLSALTILTSLSGCFGDEPEEEAPPVIVAPPPPVNITHNVSAYAGQITFQVQNAATGNVLSSSTDDIPNPVTTTTNYTGLVAKLEWTPSSAASERLEIMATPEGDGEPVMATGASPLRIAIDMSVPSPRTWTIAVSSDDTSTPVAGGANQPFTVTIGQYAGQNGTFDPEWDPVA